MSMKGEHPFIYVSSLMRTGSTVLSEALTRFPYSFIFREPHLGKNYFALKDLDTELFAERDVDLRRFVRSPIPGIGKIGAFNARHRKRANEFRVHGNEITAQRVNRWKSETNETLRADAAAVFHQMADYCEFWGYSREGLKDRNDIRRLQPTSEHR